MAERQAAGKPRLSFSAVQEIRLIIGVRAPCYQSAAANWGSVSAQLMTTPGGQLASVSSRPCDHLVIDASDVTAH